VVPERPLDTPILLKPNIGGFGWFRNPKQHAGDNGVTGRTTDPEFVRGVIHCLKARGHTRLTISDGFGGKPEDWQRLVRVSGYEAMAREEAVTLVAIDDDGVFDVEGDKPGKPLRISGMEKTTVPTLLVAKLLAEHLDKGLYIAIPKIKAHRFAVFSLGIKAMQGNVMYSDRAPAYKQKWRSHRELDGALAAIKRGDADARARYVAALEAFAERMTDVLEIATPDVVLAEGAPAMSGDGFNAIVRLPDNVAIGGTNVIAVDRIAAEYLGFWNSDALARELGGHRTSPLLEAAAKRFGVDIDKPEVTGDGAKLLATPRAGHLIGMAGFVIGGGPREIHAARVDAAPVIDGVDDDDAWDAAMPIRFDTDWMGRSTPHATQVRIAWSPAGLHVLWQLDGAALDFTDTARPITEERVDLYKEDCVEIFLAPDPAARKRYAEIEVGPYGHFFDLMIDRTTKPFASDAAWSGKLTIATRRDAKRATIEMTIAAPEIAAALVPKAKLPIGLYRMEGKGKRQYLAAFPTRTPKPSFHVPDAFGTLILDP
jgi:uncharacterized protein (DUF362 family)